MICAIDKVAALAMKERLRCGWQPVAQALGVSVTDLRRACDPAFAMAQFTAPPVGAGKAVEGKAGEGGR